MDDHQFELIVRNIVGVIEKNSPITNLFNRERVVDSIMIEIYHIDDVNEYLRLDDFVLQD